MAPAGGRPPVRATPRGAARLRRHGRDAGRALHHRRGRRHVEPRHERDRRADRIRRGARPQPWRLGRSQPADGARRRGGDRASLRAGVLDRSLRGRTVCVIGLGHVGLTGRQALCPRRAELWSPTSTSASARCAGQLDARWTSPDGGAGGDVDVLVPCALGGVFDHETVPRLRCRVVAGAANNQLARDRIADLLPARRDPVGA